MVLCTLLILLFIKGVITIVVPGALCSRVFVFFFSPLCREGDVYLYKQANNTVSQLRTKFLRQCAALPPVPLIQPRPSVVLINRPYNDGRSILGLDEIYVKLRAKLPPGVDLSLRIPRGGMTLHEQASLFNDASVVVIPHGAATANFNFLSLDTVILDVFALERKRLHDRGILDSLPSPPYNLTMIPIDCASKCSKGSHL